MNIFSIDNLAKAMELIVKHEGDLVYSLNSAISELQEESDSRHVLEGNELSTESLPYVTWEFVHGVFLNFTIEELFQVLWSAHNDYAYAIIFYS